MTKRINMSLPDNLLAELNSLIKPRLKSKFVAEAIKDKIDKVKKERLNSLLKEGYKATHKEDIDITKEFEIADREDWDEY